MASPEKLRAHAEGNEPNDAPKEPALPESPQPGGSTAGGPPPTVPTDESPTGTKSVPFGRAIEDRLAKLLAEHLLAAQQPGAGLAGSGSIEAALAAWKAERRPQ